jgi:CPA2 family monovalent cation:H+ antiporter-2
LSRAVRAAAFDAVVLIALTGLTLALQSQASAWVEARFALSPLQARSLVGAAALLTAVPFFAALFRNARSIAGLVSARILPPERPPTPSSRIAARMFRITLSLVIVLAVGLPAIAILRPFTSEAYGALVLALLVAAIGVYLWRSSGAIDDEFRTGVEQIAEALKKHAGEDQVMTLRDPTLIPGLDTVDGVALSPDSYAVDKTLAEVNLRCRTGATVVAIHRGASDVLLPTGHETLLAGDVLAVTGTQDSLDKARLALLEGTRVDRG